jgi:hypothetical protein
LNQILPVEIGVCVYNFSDVAQRFESEESFSAAIDAYGQQHILRAHDKYTLFPEVNVRGIVTDSLEINWQHTIHAHVVMREVVEFNPAPMQEMPEFALLFLANPLSPDID